MGNAKGGMRYFLDFSNPNTRQDRLIAIFNLMEHVFTGILMNWHRTENTRQMPWKGVKDPYKIWLSEIILQQTRVEQGLDYYRKFIQKFPKIEDLAKAKDQDVFKMWEGLGYYNRCKNLLFTARKIVAEHQARFPESYDALLSLKGVGPYTAAAIASFAFQLPYAVVDGNVYRVLARYFGIHIATDSKEGKELFQQLATHVLDKTDPAAYNQAIMDFGATVCKPFAPICMECPLHQHCKGFKEAVVNILPVKEKRLLKKKRWLNYFLFEKDQKVLVQQRIEKDIWENLFEFYLVEAEELIQWDQEIIISFLKKQLGIPVAIVIDISAVFSQQLTHQQIKARFIRIKLFEKPASLKKLKWQTLKNLHQLPFPKIINEFLLTEHKGN